MARSESFEPVEIKRAFLFAAILQVAFGLLLTLAGSGGSLEAHKERVELAIPIAVKPVLDPLPLLKKGGKRVKYKLPDMWKQPPPVKRYEASSAPSEKAEKTPEAIPSSKLAKPDAAAPPPDAALAKSVDEDIPKTDAAPEEPNVDEEGAADGVEEGTETDPLKARAVSLYRVKIMGWFNRRFHPSEDDAPCEELRQLRTRVLINIGGEREVSSYSVVGGSGNSAYDARVKRTMDGIVGSGEPLPPPPQNYPDILGTTEVIAFAPAGLACKATPARPRAPKDDEAGDENENKGSSPSEAPATPTPSEPPEDP